MSHQVGVHRTKLGIYRLETFVAPTSHSVIEQKSGFHYSDKVGLVIRPRNMIVAMSS